MSAIGKGDWVECVNAVPGVRSMISPGHLYCVDEATPFNYPCGYCEDTARPCGQLGLRLSGVTPRLEGYTTFFCANDFRPIYRPRADLIEQLKQPAPDAVRELEDA